MQVIEANNGLLTNFEVLNLLRERKQARSLFSSVTTQDQGASLVNTSSMVSERQRIDSQHRLAIENKTFQYFQRKMLSDCSLEEISNYLLQMKQHAFNFTESEYIQLANLLPESDVEFYLILENCSERFTEEEIHHLKVLVAAIRDQQRARDKQDTERPAVAMEDAFPPPLSRDEQ